MFKLMKIQDNSNEEKAIGNMEEINSVLNNIK